MCITVFLVWGTLNASEQLAALYFEDVSGKSALTASLYFLPALICGLLINIAIYRGPCSLSHERHCPIVASHPVPS